MREETVSSGESKEEERHRPPALDAESGVEEEPSVVEMYMPELRVSTMTSDPGHGFLTYPTDATNLE